MAEPPSRSARVVLVTPEGQLIGALPPVAVAWPWWQEVAPVVDAVRKVYGIDIIVLRILSSEKPGPPGGEVTYLSETASEASAETWAGVLDDHPLRMPYAKPGGPAADLAWADAILADRGFVRTGPPQQIRTWNLSSLWKLPVAGEALWLKAVPPFFAHEGPHPDAGDSR